MRNQGLAITACNQTIITKLAFLLIHPVSFFWSFRIFKHRIPSLDSFDIFKRLRRLLVLLVLKSFFCGRTQNRKNQLCFLRLFLSVEASVTTTERKSTNNFSISQHFSQKSLKNVSKISKRCFENLLSRTHISFLLFLFILILLYYIPPNFACKCLNASLLLKTCLYCGARSIG